MPALKTKTVRISRETMKRLEALRRPNESMREVVERVLDLAEVAADSNRPEPESS